MEVRDVFKVGDWWEHKKTRAKYEITHVDNHVVTIKLLSNGALGGISRSDMLSGYKQIRKETHRRVKMLFNEHQLANASGIPADVKVITVIPTQDPVGVFMVLEGDRFDEVPLGAYLPIAPGWHIQRGQIDMSKVLEVLDKCANAPDTVENEFEELRETVQMCVDQFGPIWHSEINVDPEVTDGDRT